MLRRTSTDTTDADVPEVTPEGGTALRLLGGFNIHAELEDCGCRSHPLGGLARRATLADQGRQGAPGAFVHLDAGNALLNRIELPDAHPVAMRNRVEETARAILQTYGMMDVAAMAVGPQDLILGATWLQQEAQAAGLPLVATNLRSRAGSGRPFASHHVVEASGVRVGVLSVMSPSGQIQPLLAASGLQADDPVAAAASEVRLLRAELPPVDLVLLIETHGAEHVESLLSGLRGEDALPDMLWVSGSGRMQGSPAYVHDVPWVEGGSRGKQLVQLDLTLRSRPARFRAPSDPQSMALAQMRSSLVGIRSTLRALTRWEGDPSRTQAIEGYQRMLGEHYRAWQQASLQLARGRGEARGTAGETGPVSSVASQVLPVELEIVERDDIRVRVNAAKEAMGLVQPPANP
jgi:2',3'-cyclic-nucleotide 2'-phosphodiesterase (5'-nucleotidase family)